MRRNIVMTLMGVAVVAAMLLGSCGRPAWYDQVASVDETGWLPADSVRFEVEVSDTTALYDILLEVRNNVSYPYSNLFLMINTTFPDGSIAHDTLECPLTDVEGRWLGKRAGRYVDGRYRLRSSSMTFPMAGRYSFAITNGMRDRAVVGVRSVGLRIEEAEQ